MPFNKDKNPFITILSIVLAIVILFYAVRIFSLQVLSREKYSNQISGATQVTSVLKAPRGEILDCDGRQIAINRDGYDIVFNKQNIDLKNINSLIVRLIELCEEQKCEYVDLLPLNKKAPYGFEDEVADKKIISFLNLAGYATAENCFDRFVERYELDGYSKDMQRKIMGVRYSMDKSSFSLSIPYTFAEDINDSLMLTISETGHSMPGVTVEVTPYRYYPVTDLAPHLIGTTGPIYEEEWEKYKEKGYSYNDKVGKSGIEMYAEEALHGIDGEITHTLDKDGNIINSEVTKEPVPGKTVMLTIDKNLQSASQKILEQNIKKLQSQGGSVTGGAVVVMDIKNGGVKASANYPSYDLATLSKNYNKLVSDKNTPLLDRAFKGIYPIGSTIKPAVAIAGLENNKITKSETIYCKRTYTYFGDFQPECMHFHGHIALNTAISKSCNYYFFEVGRRLGIKKLNTYFKDFGLGVATGVEVNDSAGLLTEYDSDSGNTIQVAIGQLNAFTPLQLAVYTSTLANGGTRYKATLIDKVVSADQRETFFKNKSEVLGTVELSDASLNAVKRGMLSVTEDGTGRAVFASYPIKIGGKTGTSQTDNGADHSVFVSFAPYENPEIVVAVVLEHGSSTFGVTSVAKAVFDQYFFAAKQESDEILPYVVLE